MVYLFYFKGIKKIEESKHSLPEKLTVISLDDDFIPRGSSEYIFEQPEKYEIFSGDIDKIVLDKWQPVMEDVVYDLGETPRIIFFSERDLRLFSIMKNKFRIHIGAWGYYSIEAMSELAELEESKSEFKLIKERLKDEYKEAAYKSSKGANSIEDKIRTLCSKYNMKAEIKSGTAYITTYAGEWYFSYNDRPITLYHKNSIPVKDKNGRIKRHSHIQPAELYSPLHALAYIRNHEAAEEKRLMGKP